METERIRVRRDWGEGRKKQGFPSDVYRVSFGMMKRILEIVAMAM